MVGAEGAITFANAAAEDFFGASRSHAGAQHARQVRAFGSPLLTLVDQVRERRAPVNEYRVDISSPRLGIDKLVDIYVAPVPELPGSVVVMFQERSMADKIDRQMTHRGAARSVTGLAAMLAHEIKNPLSGIRGAAQLLETAVSDEDRPLTRLIPDEADRIVDLVDRMEVFGDERPIDREPINIHVVLDRVKAIARNGFASGITLRRGLRSVAAAGLRQPRPADPGVPQPGEECRRSAWRTTAKPARSRFDRVPAGHPHLGAGHPGAHVAAARIQHARQRARACRRTCCRSSSIPSSPPSPTAPASASRWWPRSSATMAASSNATSRRGTTFRILLPVWKEMPAALPDAKESHRP